MVTTEAQKRAVIKYAKKNLKRIPLDVPLDMYDQIKEHSEACGESVNGYIKAAITERMKNEDNQ
ncbi:MAG TPA: hypothetical protein DCY81_01035 [Lachnospiraceae bacterium]|nr:hypothetical protein [Lachnospiraceae bacterium]